MRNLGRILLFVAALVLALLIGVLIGQRRSAEPTTEQPASGVQITTEAPVSTEPAAPLPAPVVAPPAAAPITAPPVDQQVQDDAAAVGMTTRDEPEAGDEPSGSAGSQGAETGAEVAPATN